MRAEPNKNIDRFRVQLPGYASPAGVNYGCFVIECFVSDHQGARLKVISSGSGISLYERGLPKTAQGWEHVSVSLDDRTPTWEEMDFVKDLFWGGHETVVQFHPAKSAKVNYHPNCLHLWKRLGMEYDLPHQILIGPVGG